MEINAYFGVPYSNHVTSSDLLDTLICYTTMNSDFIHFWSNDILQFGFINYV